MKHRCSIGIAMSLTKGRAYRLQTYLSQMVDKIRHRRKPMITCLLQYTKTILDTLPSAIFRGGFGISPGRRRDAVGTASASLRLGFDSEPKSSRTAPEAESKPTRRVPEALPNNSRSGAEQLPSTTQTRAWLKNAIFNKFSSFSQQIRPTCQVLVKHYLSTDVVLFAQQLRKIMYKGEMYLSGTGQVQSDLLPASSFQKKSLSSHTDDYRVSLAGAYDDYRMSLASHKDDYGASLLIVQQKGAERLWSRVKRGFSFIAKVFLLSLKPRLGLYFFLDEKVYKKSRLGRYFAKIVDISLNISEPFHFVSFRRSVLNGFFNNFLTRYRPRSLGEVQDRTDLRNRNARSVEYASYIDMSLFNSGNVTCLFSMSLKPRRAITLSINDLYAKEWMIASQFCLDTKSNQNRPEGVHGLRIQTRVHKSQDCIPLCCHSSIALNKTELASLKQRFILDAPSSEYLRSRNARSVESGDEVIKSRKFVLNGFFNNFLTRYRPRSLGEVQDRTDLRNQNARSMESGDEVIKSRESFLNSFYNNFLTRYRSSSVSLNALKFRAHTKWQIAYCKMLITWCKWRIAYCKVLIACSRMLIVLLSAKSYPLFTKKEKLTAKKKKPIAHSLLLIAAGFNCFAKALKNILAILILASMFNLSAQESRSNSGTNGSTAIKPLQIGDTIPEELWHMPLQVVNHPDGKNSVTLNDYRHQKLIVLDFWATWCAPCVKSIDKWEDISQSLGQQVGFLAVHIDHAYKADPFMKKREWKSASIVGEDAYTLNDLFFDRDVISRLVWIYDNRLLTITGTQDHGVIDVLNILKGDTEHIPINTEWTHGRRDAE